MRVVSLKRVENSVAKGEIAHYEHLLLYPYCFQKSSAADVSTSGKGLTKSVIYEFNNKIAINLMVSSLTWVFGS